MDIVGQIIGFVSGVAASWIFLYMLILVKPKITVSPFVAFNPDTGALLIKVRNQRRRQATDIEASLSVVRRLRDGRLITLHSAALRRSNLAALGPIQDLEKPWKLLVTYVFATDEGREILEKLNTPDENERRLVFTISAVDAVSGTKRVKLTTFSKESVKVGKFGIGFDFISHSDKSAIDAVISDDE